jgi:hypothetical protein
MGKVQPGGIHVLKTCKIHEEQITNMAGDLKERYHTRRPYSQSRGSSGSGNIKQKNGNAGRALSLRVQKTTWKAGPVERSVMEGQNNLLPIMETPGQEFTAIHCYRCGIVFPVADFHYTQKSGLCIDCWEDMVR